LNAILPEEADVIVAYVEQYLREEEWLNLGSVRLYIAESDIKAFVGYERRHWSEMEGAQIVLRYLRAAKERHEAKGEVK
jgi:hypothetical protein